MKLNEIKQLIPEALNTRINLEWNKSGNILSAEFDLHERIYEIFIEYFDFAEFDIDEIKNGYEISFVGKDKESDDFASYKGSVNNTQRGHNLMVFSIVKNAVEEKLKTLNFDFIFFDAKNVDDVYQSRVSLYNKMSSLFKKQFNLQYFEKDYNNFHLFVLSKHDIERELIDNLIKLITH